MTHLRRGAPWFSFRLHLRATFLLSFGRARKERKFHKSIFRFFLLYAAYEITFNWDLTFCRNLMDGWHRMEVPLQIPFFSRENRAMSIEPGFFSANPCSVTYFCLFLSPISSFQHHGNNGLRHGESGWQRRVRLHRESQSHQRGHDQVDEGGIRHGGQDSRDQSRRRHVSHGQECQLGRFRNLWLRGQQRDRPGTQEHHLPPCQGWVWLFSNLPRFSRYKRGGKKEIPKWFFSAKMHTV